MRKKYRLDPEGRLSWSGQSCMTEGEALDHNIGWRKFTPATGYDWLASGGAYWVLGVGWVTSAVFFGYFALRAGRLAGSHNDGCLLSICAVIMTFAGGGIGLYAGLLLTRYPTFVLT